MTMRTPPRRQIPLLLLVLAAMAGLARAEDDLTTALEVFRSWKQGSPVSQLAQARQAVFRGTDNPAVCTAHEAALLAFLQTDADGQAKQRALGWLGDIAGEASVAPMAVLLKDPDLSSAARGVLERIPGPAANKALVGALQRLTDKARLGVVDSLARRNEASGGTALVQLLQTTEDPFLQEALVAALGTMDSPDALAALREFDPPEQSSRSHGLAILSIADRERLRGNAAGAANLYGQQLRGGCESLREEAFLGLLATSKSTRDALLRRALADDRLRDAALRRIHAGDGSPALLGELVGELEQDAAVIQPAMVHALAIRPDIRSHLRPALRRVVQNRTGGSRLLAIEALGLAGGAEEAKILLALASDPTGDPDAVRAASTALERMPDPAVGEFLAAEAARPSDPARQKTALTTLGVRGGPAAATTLWTVARDEKSPNLPTALDALAAMLPPKAFPDLLAYFLASEGKTNAAAAKSAVWTMLRRLPDQDAAIRQADAAAASASPESAAALREMTARVRPANKKTEPKPKPQASVPFPEADDRAALQPDGYREVLLHNAGTTGTTRNGALVMRRSAGEEFTFFAGSHPLATVDFGEEIRYGLTGLSPDRAYVLGLTWWDADQQGRLQELRIDGELALPATPPLAWHADQATWSRVHLPVPASALEDGKLDLSITRTAGPNAVVNRVWLLEREAKVPATKRILIVTGDDFRGHRWRETGPEIAAILRNDPRLEVTISETPSILSSPLLGHYDAVMIHFKNYAKRLPTSQALWDNLDRYVRDGGGLVVAHFGCGALQEWDGFVKLGGRVWNPKFRGHDPYGEFSVHIINDKHPATRNMEDFTTRDELYTCLDGDTPIEILADATSIKDQKNYPMAFTVRDAGKGRVFHCPLGHDTGALAADGTRRLYRQGVAWAAGL